jgi:hypothetical protein
MSYLKCVPCRVRLDRAGPEAQLFDRGCPICGSPLEPAAELSELVGFQAFDLAQGDPVAVSSEDRNRSVRRVRDAMGTRDATVAQIHLDAERWLDDGGRFSSGAVARWGPPRD